jgi:hypothetical protein
MRESYCRSCYRVLPSEETICPGCAAARTPKRIVMILGVAGLPLLIAGVLSLNSRACIAGAILSGSAALLYAALSLRQ